MVWLLKDYACGNSVKESKDNIAHFRSCVNIDCVFSFKKENEQERKESLIWSMIKSLT